MNILTKLEKYYLSLLRKSIREVRLDLESPVEEPRKYVAVGLSGITNNGEHVIVGNGRSLTPRSTWPLTIQTRVSLSIHSLVVSEASDVYVTGMTFGNHSLLACSGLVPLSSEMLIPILPLVFTKDIQLRFDLVWMPNT